MKIMAGSIMAIGFVRITLLAIATIMDLGTAAERVNDRFDAIVILALGAILWQITKLANQRVI